MIPLAEERFNPFSHRIDFNVDVVAGFEFAKESSV
jgi:hypothetical protein